MKPFRLCYVLDARIAFKPLTISPTVPLENPEISERMEVIPFIILKFSTMLISLTTLLATLSWILRSRAALQLENLVLRHQIGVLQRSAAKRPKLIPVDRLLWICLSRLWRDWRSALTIVKPETVIAWASCRLSAVLDVEGPARPTRTTAHFARGSRSDPQDVPGESQLGCTPHPRRNAQARHPHR